MKTLKEAAAAMVRELDELESKAMPCVPSCRVVLDLRQALDRLGECDPEKALEELADRIKLQINVSPAGDYIDCAFSTWWVPSGNLPNLTAYLKGREA